MYTCICYVYMHVYMYMLCVHACTYIAMYRFFCTCTYNHAFKLDVYALYCAFLFSVESCWLEAVYSYYGGTRYGHSPHILHTLTNAPTYHLPDRGPQTPTGL